MLNEDQQNELTDVYKKLNQHLVIDDKKLKQ